MKVYQLIFKLLSAGLFKTVVVNYTDSETDFLDSDISVEQFTNAVPTGWRVNSYRERYDFESKREPINIVYIRAKGY